MRGLWLSCCWLNYRAVLPLLSTHCLFHLSWPQHTRPPGLCPPCRWKSQDQEAWKSPPTFTGWRQEAQVVSPLAPSSPGALTAAPPSCLSSGSAVCLPESRHFLTYNIMSQGCIKLLQSLADIWGPPLLPCFLPLCIRLHLHDARFPPHPRRASPSSNF